MIADSLVGVFHNRVEFAGERLDLSYITSQFIVSAMPTDKYWQRLYRMDTQSLVYYLNTKHGRNWHIWNLQEEHELGYDPELMSEGCHRSLVSRFPIPDHRPPPFAIMVGIATQLREYVELNPNNVAVIHCKCGKGRSGTIAIAYLMLFHGMSFERASKTFTQKRIRFGLVTGVSIQSQRRYLRYLDRWITGSQEPHYLDTAPGYSIVHVIIRHPKFEDYDFKLEALSPYDESDDVVLNLWDITFKERYIALRPVNKSALLPPDIWVEVTGYNTMLGYRVPVSSAKFALNVKFESDDTSTAYPEMDQVFGSSASGVFTPMSNTGTRCLKTCMCQWEDSDGIAGSSAKGTKAFDSVEIFWKRADEFKSMASTTEGDLV